MRVSDIMNCPVYAWNCLKSGAHKLTKIFYNFVYTPDCPCQSKHRIFAVKIVGFSLVIALIMFLAFKHFPTMRTYYKNMFTVSTPTTKPA